MKYLLLDQETLQIIDEYFNSTFFAFSQFNEKQIELYDIFPWTHDFNSEDIQIMFEDLQKQIYLDNYIPKKYLKTPVKFLNYVMKQIPSLKDHYLKPQQSCVYFRTYLLIDR